MANYVWRGISGQEVHHLNPAAWTVNGADTAKAPGPGDTLTFISPGTNSVPVFATPGARVGDTVSGQTLNFGVTGAARQRIARFNGTTLDASTTVNVTGPSQLQFDGSGLWGGVFNVGTPAGSADLQVLLNGTVRLLGKAYELINSGTVNATNASKLNLHALVGGATLSAGFGSPLNTSFLTFTEFDFYNKGTINVSGGSTFVYDSIGETAGFDNHLINDGTIRVQGGGDLRNTVRLDADVSGTGTIVLDGGDAPSNLQTWLITTGDVTGQTVVLRNAYWTAADGQGYSRIGTYDAQGNFVSGSVSAVLQGGRNTIFLEASHQRAGDSVTPDIDTPFGATIYGFTAGDTLIAREPYSTDVYVSWDQSKQTLTVIDPSYDAGNGKVLSQLTLAQFYLEGQYAASDFVVSGEKANASYAYDVVRVTTTNTRNAGAAPAPTVTFTPDRRGIQDTPGNQRYVGDAGLETLVVAEGARGSTLVGRPGGEVAFVHAGQTDILRDVSALRFLDGRLVLDADDPAARVARLYQAGLGRAPDTAGLSFWAGRVQAGAPLEELAQGFLGSAEFQARIGANATDAQFVAGLYRNVLGREPDAGGLQYWTGRLSQGAGRASVLVGLSESAENKQVTAGLVSNGLWVLDQGAAQVARLYDTVFGRVPDAGGLAFWSGQIASGAIGVQGVADRLVGSAEFQARYGALGDRDFVAAMYANTLDRAPDAGGLDYWTARLGAGATRAGVVAGLSESAEHQQLTAATVLGSTSGQWGIVTA